MKNLYFLLIILFFISFSSLSQEFRSYIDNANEADKICAAYAGKGFVTDKAANAALNKILSTIGASKRFVLSSCQNIPNAMAISLKGIRYIFYNREFMNQINTNTNYWSNMSILAHEVGHHINGHTTDALLIINDVVESESLSQSRKMELEADEFAGFVLAKLGATLSEATEAIYLLSSDEDDTYSTHPSKSKRIAAITKGYNNASTEKEDEITSTYSNIPDVAEVFFYSGYEKANNEDYYGAIEDYTISIELKPNFLVYYHRGASKHALNDYNEAISDFTNAINIVADRYEPYYARAASKLGLNDDYGAISDFTKAIDIKPDNHKSFYWRGTAKKNLNDYNGAISDYNIALELDPNHIDSYVERGFSKLKLKDYYGAISDFTKAIEFDPTNYISYYNRGVSKYDLKDFNGAISDFNKAIEIDPKKIMPWEGRGLVKFELKDFYGSISDQTKVIELNPKNSGAYLNRALSKYLLGDTNGACSDGKISAGLGSKKAEDFISSFCK